MHALSHGLVKRPVSELWEQKDAAVVVHDCCGGEGGKGGGRERRGEEEGGGEGGGGERGGGEEEVGEGLGEGERVGVGEGVGEGTEAEGDGGRVEGMSPPFGLILISAQFQNSSCDGIWQRLHTWFVLEREGHQREGRIINRDSECHRTSHHISNT